LSEGGRREAEEGGDLQHEADAHADDVGGDVKDGRSYEGVLEESEEVWDAGLARVDDAAALKSIHKVVLNPPEVNVVLFTPVLCRVTICELHHQTIRSINT